MLITKNFVSRILEGSILSFIAFLAIFFAYTMPLGSWFFAFLLIGMTTVACWEYCQLIQKKGLQPFTPLLLTAGAGYLLLYAASLFGVMSSTVSLFWLVVSVGAFALPLMRSAKEVVVSAAVTITGFIYIFIPTQLLLDMTYSSTGASTPSRWWLVWILLVAKGSDSFAYFGGKLLGKRPLTAISPQKTWEGFFIGCGGGALLSTLMGFCPGAPSWSSITFFLVGALLSAIACVGDLIESRLKREVGAKDSNSIPGLGGVLDMADSLLLTIPFAYLLFSLVARA